MIIQEVRDKWFIYCPSYKRPHSAFSHKLFDAEKFAYVVREEEVELYRKSFPGTRVISIPAGAVSNLLETRHWIFDNKHTDYVVMVDDDMKQVTVFEPNKVRRTLAPAEISTLLDQGFLLSEDCGAGYWGINCQNDCKFYQQNRPLSFSNIVNGPFMCVLDTEIRSDDRMPLKEDYDLFLQQLMKHRKVLRLNMYNYTVDHMKMAGGCQIYRTTPEEKRQNQLLVKKWGAEIISPNWRHENSINMVIRRPI